MSETVIVAIISLVGTLFGSLGGIVASGKLTGYRIDRLEEQVKKHNSIIERTYIIEKDITEMKEDIKEIKTDVKSLDSKLYSVDNRVSKLESERG